MRVYNRTDFMKSPAGTIFSKGKKWQFNNINVKAETLDSNDFVALDPCWMESYDSGQAVDRLEGSLENGTSYPMEDAFGRDGCFDDEDLFLVFEKDDLLKLRAFIDRAISAQP